MSEPATSCPFCAKIVSATDINGHLSGHTSPDSKSPTTSPPPIEDEHE